MHPIFTPCLFSITSTNWPALDKVSKVPVSNQAVPASKTHTVNLLICKYLFIKDVISYSPLSLLATVLAYSQTLLSK